jgi:SAM-dependent methyltransferase
MPAHIDLPQTDIAGPSFIFAGWVATNAWDAKIAVRVNGKPIVFNLQPRPDVREVPELSRYAFTSGVTASISLDGEAHDGSVLVELVCDRETVARRVAVTGATAAPAPAPPPGTPAAAPPAAARPAASAAAPPPPPVQAAAAPPSADPFRAESRAWCMAHLRCPACKADASRLAAGGGALVCAQCRSEFIQNTAAINLISAELGLRANIAPTDNVSANPYTPDALHLIETTTSKGGWVLDCGAGSRPARMRHVINVEIVDYPSTDVLAVGEALPFADGSFDAILSLAVLEHVRDPFACAREIMRVLKPGGEVLADVPFLQPLHGYPHHYYNMTQQGLANLFRDMGEVLEVRVPLHGHPIFGVQWLLGQYVHGLPEEQRAVFSRMTVGELAAITPHTFLTTPPAYMLAPETQNTIACLNTIRIRKS